MAEGAQTDLQTCSLYCIFIIMYDDHHNSWRRTSRVPTPSSPLTATSASLTGELLGFGKVLDEVELGEVASIIFLVLAQTRAC